MVGKGRTTRQMEEAPIGAVFIWCNADLRYPKRLAGLLGREDLIIVSPSWLDQAWRARRVTGLVIDHYTKLTDRQKLGRDAVLHRLSAYDAQTS